MASPDKDGQGVWVAAAAPGLPRGDARYPPSKGGRRVLAVALLAQMSSALPVYLTAALALQIGGEFPLGAQAVGGATAAFFVAAGVASLGGGRLADKIEWRGALRSALVLSALALIAVSLLVRNYAGLVICLLVSGVSFAIAAPASSLALAKETPAHQQSMAFGLKQGAMPLATLVSGISVPVVGLSFGWRVAFMMAAAFPLATLWLMPRKVAPTYDAIAYSRVTIQILRVRPILVVALAAALGSAASGSAAAFLFISAVDAGLTQAEAGRLIAVASASVLVVRIGSGWIAGLRGGTGMRFIVVLLSLGAVGLLLLSTGRPGLLLPGALLAYGAGWGWGGLLQYGLVRHFAHAPGTACGFAEAGMSAGSALGPLAFGAVSVRLGYGFAWVGTAGSALIAALLMLIAIRKIGSPPPALQNGIS